MLLENTNPVEETLLQYEPEKYWAVWQFPEGRYAYMIGLRREAWLIVMDTREAGEHYLASDAAMNGRPVSAYRMDELTLPDAFDAVRAQSVPFLSSQGFEVLKVMGVEIRTRSFLGTKAVRHIPL